MEYAAVALAVFGTIVGLRYRFRVLLPFVVLVFLASVVFSPFVHLSAIETLLTILAAEAVLQGGYVVGLIVRASFKDTQRELPVSSEKCRSS